MKEAIAMWKRCLVHFDLFIIFFPQTRLLVKRGWETPSYTSFFTILAKIFISVLPLMVI